MSSSIQGYYHGKSGPLFGLFLKTTLLTLLTLGIYRFWAKTRIRKYIWSATTGQDDSFEYTGTGLEKFLGFLIAVVILAIYLGIFQTILFYFGIFLFDEPQTEAEFLLQLAGIYITLFAVAPLIFFAQYRARRYKMARTRWRGLRFGMDSEAWGYVWRAIGHNLLTLITLGALLPRQTFYLEKYMTDRTWYGDARFVQNGKWTALYPGMKHAIIGIVILLITLAIIAITLSGQGGNPTSPPAILIVAIFVGYIWLAIGIVSYRVYAFNYLTAHKTLDNEITFRAAMETTKVVSTYIVGGLVIIGLFVVLGVAAGVLMTGFFAATFAAGGDPTAVQPTDMIGVFIGLALFYLVFLLLIGGVSLVLITQKIIAHAVNGITVSGTDHLDTIRQRAADKGADADGFADALDIGGAL